MLAIEPSRGLQAACVKLSPLIVAKIAFRELFQVITYSLIEAFAHLLRCILGALRDSLVH